MVDSFQKILESHNIANNYELNKVIELQILFWNKIFDREEELFGKAFYFNRHYGRNILLNKNIFLKKVYYSFKKINKRQF